MPFSRGESKDTGGSSVMVWTLIKAQHISVRDELKGGPGDVYLEAPRRCADGKDTLLCRNGDWWSDRLF
jgi:hypothetical protein